MTQHQQPDRALDFDEQPSAATDAAAASGPASASVPASVPGSVSGPASGPALDLTDGVWDVAVVGAGPSGASAALAAAASGARVLLLEKAELPRYKTCGGGIIGPSRASLPPGMKLPLRDRVRAVTFTHEGRKQMTRRYRSTLFGLVNRDEFDQRLVECAVEAGAVLVTGVTVGGVEQAGGEEAGVGGAGAAQLGAAQLGAARLGDGETVNLRLGDGRTVRARAVVGADGSASRVARHVGVTFDQVDLGLEAEIPVPPTVAADYAGRVVIDWGPLPGSYGWVFPKGDSLTVGVIAARGQGEATRAYLDGFIAKLGLAGFEPRISSGHLTRCRAEDSPLSRGRVLVAGDAAGLLEPWTREGISFALRSGRMAGEWAVEVARAQGEAEARTFAAQYGIAVRSGLGVEMAAGRRLLAAFERRPGLFHLAVTWFPPAWRAFTAVVSGRTTFAEVLQRRRVIQRMVTLFER